MNVYRCVLIFWSSDIRGWREGLLMNLPCGQGKDVKIKDWKNNMQQGMRCLLLEVSLIGREMLCASVDMHGYSFSWAPAICHFYREAHMRKWWMYMRRSTIGYARVSYCYTCSPRYPAVMDHLAIGRTEEAKRCSHRAFDLLCFNVRILIFFYCWDD